MTGPLSRVWNARPGRGRWEKWHKVSVSPGGRHTVTRTYQVIVAAPGRDLVQQLLPQPILAHHGPVPFLHAATKKRGPGADQGGHRAPVRLGLHTRRGRRGARAGMGGGRNRSHRTNTARCYSKKTTVQRGSDSWHEASRKLAPTTANRAAGTCF